jgi:chorismate lyase/3-hydroxybenzoate synthase
MTVSTLPVDFDDQEIRHVPVRPSFHTGHDLNGESLADGRAILAVIGFGAGRPVTLAAAIPFVQIPMKLLKAGPCYEVWSSPQRVAIQRSGPVHFAIAGDMLFGVLPLDQKNDENLESLAYESYSRILRLADETGYRNLIRVFNYLPDITAEIGGTERYRLFNAGRYRALAAYRRPLEAAPAACALGTREGAPAIYFLASRHEGVAIENPRQLSAYHYPPQYGRISPSFSRAMTISQGGACDLYISGTASIVGHESQHYGDPAAQAEEALRNIQAVLFQCGDMALTDADLLLKIYVRRPGDISAIEPVLDRSVPNAHIMMVQADICRPELLVEIEGFSPLPHEARGIFPIKTAPSW